MASALDESGVRGLPHMLEADGYKISICPYCRGFGYTSGINPFNDEFETEKCTHCCGTGRVATKVRTETVALNALLTPYKKLTDD